MCKHCSTLKRGVRGVVRSPRPCPTLIPTLTPPLPCRNPSPYPNPYPYPYPNPNLPPYQEYVDFMTTPGSHNDAYASSYHRRLFQNLTLTPTPSPEPYP